MQYVCRLVYNLVRLLGIRQSPGLKPYTAYSSTIQCVFVTIIKVSLNTCLKKLHRIFPHLTILFERDPQPCVFLMSMLSSFRGLYFNPNDNQNPPYLFTICHWWICYSNKQKYLNCIGCNAIIRHLTITAFKMVIFCMMSAHNAQERVKTICRDCLLQDSSYLVFSGIITPPRSNHNRHKYLN